MLQERQHPLLVVPLRCTWMSCTRFMCPRIRVCRSLYLQMVSVCGGCLYACAFVCFWTGFNVKERVCEWMWF